MVKSAIRNYGHARFFWKPPWKSRTTGILRPTIEATPWLCLDCGVVLAFVEGETLSTLRQEFEEQRSGVTM